MSSNTNLQRSLERLLSGVRYFREREYPQRKQAYDQVTREGQRPHTLFITCADSRIDPELITQSGPGDIFVARNVGNLVPAYGEMIGAISAVIEYAVSALDVDQIVICGHADCGAMKALLRPEGLDTMPIVQHWLRNAHAALSITEAIRSKSDETQFLKDLIEQNVLLQMNHLRTHPSVAGRLAQGRIAVYGWVYDFGSGDVLMYQETENRFEPIR
jgi:carbonic anhydrase